MKRINKAGLLLVRPLFRHGKWHVGIEIALFDLGAIQILPTWFYKGLYWPGMQMNEISCLRKQANWTIHHIPLNIRFQIA